MLNPILDYEVAKARHRELEAEFEQYRRERTVNVDSQSLPIKRRLILGLGSIVLGVLMIFQSLTG